MSRPATTKVRCPDCGSRNLSIIETGEWTTEWSVRDGKLDRSEGYHNPESIDRVDCRCSDCGRRWKPRKAWQIDDIVQEPSHDL